MAQAASDPVDGLTKTAGGFLKHAFSIAMIGMMVSVALPAVAAATTGGAATLGDLGLAVVDHYATMFTAPFTEFGTVTDIFNNTMAGDFAPAGYELGGGMAHAGHGGHAMLESTASAVSAHAGHGAMSTCLPFNDWAAANPSQLATLNTSAGGMGVSSAEYYRQTFCH